MPKCRLAALFVALLVLAVPSLASAATLSVDDDRMQCAAAPYTSVQAAVDAAAPGDTVAICPGTYVEGAGTVGSNALTIAKSLTLKGAGADDVTISPRRSTETGGQIAEAAPDLRNGIGDIVAVTGGAIPTTVDISGVTIDGNGVYSEAGVVFIDAQGSLNRSRVTNIITSDAATAETQPGGYRSNQHGFGVVHVSASPDVAQDAAARVLALSNTRIDRYNKAGVVVDGTRTGGTSGATVDNRVTLVGDHIVGRNLCTSATVDGNCSSPTVLTTGTLYGQDGVQLLNGAAATMTNLLVSQNAVHGTGAPVRSTGAATPSTTNNGNLRLAAGIRLLGADASSITKSNIVANAYGVYNAEGNGTTANTEVPFEAENNWWGLRYQTSAENPAPTSNPGPAVSPAFNPPMPENPVNGLEITDDQGRTSNAVDFSPHRNGFQGDPTNGQFPLASAPMPVDDAAPTVTLAASKPAAERGQVVKLTATPVDDFGAKRVTYYSGSTIVGSTSGADWSIDWTIPTDAACGSTRTFTALVEDSSGQTAASAPVSIEVKCPADEPKKDEPKKEEDKKTEDKKPVVTVTVTPPPPPAPPMPAGPTLPAGTIPDISKRGGIVNVIPNAPAGVAKVDFFLGSRRLCTVTARPFQCRIRPTGADVGVQVLRVVVTDLLGRTIESARTVRILRFAVKSIGIKLQEVALKDGGRGKSISGELNRLRSVTVAQGCRSGRVTLVLERGDTALSDVQVPLRADCTFRKTLAVPRRTRGVRYTLTARFGGNSVLLPKSTTRRFN